MVPRTHEPPALAADHVARAGRHGSGSTAAAGSGRAAGAGSRARRSRHAQRRPRPSRMLTRALRDPWHARRRLRALQKPSSFGRLRQAAPRVWAGGVRRGRRGGVRGGRVNAECRMLSGGRWRPIPPMSGPRFGACSVIIDNEMWVMGGQDDDDNDLATVEVYSPKTNSWRSCTPMSQRRDGAVAGVVGGRLVVAGGDCRGDGRLSSVEAYTGTEWTPLPPMPHACLRSHGVRAERAASCDGRLEEQRASGAGDDRGKWAPGQSRRTCPPLVF